MKTTTYLGLIGMILLCQTSNAQVMYTIVDKIDLPSSVRMYSGNGGYYYGTSPKSSGGTLPSGLTLSATAQSLGASSSAAVCNLSNTWVVQIVITGGTANKTPTGDLYYDVHLSDTADAAVANHIDGGSCSSNSAVTNASNRANVDTGSQTATQVVGASDIGGNVTPTWALNSANSTWVGTATITSDSPANNSTLNHANSTSYKDDAGTGTSTTTLTFKSLPTNTFSY